MNRILVRNSRDKRRLVKFFVDIVSDCYQVSQRKGLIILSCTFFLSLLELNFGSKGRKIDTLKLVH